MKTTQLYHPFLFLSKNGSYVPNKDGTQMLEVLNYKHEFHNPRDRFANFVNRNLSLKYIKEELKWYFCGLNEDLSIEQHAKIWQNIKNKDGTFSSNYGAIIFRSGMIGHILDRFRSDKHTRQAVISIYNNHINNDNYIDIPCTVALHFIIRDNKLNCTGLMRSNDLVFGFCNDFPFFTLVQEIVYLLVKEIYPEITLGTYTHFANSLHVYERHFDLLNEIVNNGPKINKILCPKLTLEEAKKLILNDLDPELNIVKWLNT